MPEWLTRFSWAWLCTGFFSALLIVTDVLGGHRQKMAIMNFVWPINALWLGPLGLPIYWHLGRARENEEEQQDAGKQHDITWREVFRGTLHCGAGCTLGDVAAEWLVFLTALTISGAAIWPALIFDFVAAYIAGIVFQYFSIAPMRGLHGWEGIKAALKADTLSLIAFEVGMFGWMLLMRFAFFRQHPLHPGRPEYWFGMAIAMMVGFATSFPVNWWLLRRGLKEAM